MTARRFKADVGSTADKVQHGAIPRVTHISRGDSNGEIVITYRHAGLPDALRIQALAQDESEYPDGNNFVIFTDSDHATKEVVTALEHVQEYLVGITVTEMVMEVADAVTSALAAEEPRADDTDDEDQDMTDVDDILSSDGDDDDENDDFLGNDDDYFGLGPSREAIEQRAASGTAQYGSFLPDEDLKRRIKNDLHVARQAGFRVGVLNGLGTSSVTGIVCLSFRVSKLRLSDEALLAWDVPNNDYVVLLIKYDTRYYPLETIVRLPAAHSGVQFRMGLCKTYKPAANEAVGAFSRPDNAREQPDLGEPEAKSKVFRPMFLSASLNRFMNESLISIIKLRRSTHTSWDDANELLVNAGSLRIDEGDVMLDPNDTKAETSSCNPEAEGAMSEDILSPDHLTEPEQPNNARSFPLVAMQFAMRYFARCTKYCLRCHQKVEAGFEALRPYVCSNPLCLFQYMTMGLGPNVEHEILTEPSVVDLLVSLCYASVQNATHPYRTFAPSHANAPRTFPIRQFPAGLRLQVPNLFDAKGGRPSRISVELDRSHTALIYDDSDTMRELRVNQWVVLRYQTPDRTSAPRTGPPGLESFAFSHDARITNICPEQRRVGIALVNRRDASGAVEDAVFPASVDKADVYHYNLDFDALMDAEKSLAMQQILNTLPPIAKIREYLTAHPNASLRSYDQISPAAATLLVWIVSSNRSCINEIGTLDAQHIEGLPMDVQHDPKAPCWTVKEKRKQEFIPGMHGYIQFRFAQGSPDKELRFSKALQEMARHEDLSRHPTIFAWHGSDVSNWHSILRTGLDFTDVKFGRAFGHGVYFSPDFTTSTAYAANSNVAQWPNSDLSVRSVLSLNEIINVPQRFVSHNPHYVVQEQDWHQCRYLFVAPSTCLGTLFTGDHATVAGGHVSMLSQAPGYEVHGTNGQALSIPVASMPTRLAYLAQGGPVAPSKTIVRAVASDSDESADEDLELITPEGHGGQPKLSRSSSMDTVLTRNT
jgi:ubiquitin-conjugating enzyme E2 Q